MTLVYQLAFYDIVCRPLNEFLGIMDSTFREVLVKRGTQKELSDLSNSEFIASVNVKSADISGKYIVIHSGLQMTCVF